MTGQTTARVAMQYVSSERAFQGTKELGQPPAQADLDYSRVLFTLELYHQLSAQVGLGVVLPYFEQDSDNLTVGTSDHDAGLGDITFYLGWSPWAHEGERRFLDVGNLAWSIGISIPTGDELAGELPGLHSYHLGSGSEEYKFGARYSGWVSDPVLLFLGASAVVDGGVNRTGFKYGNSYDFYAGAAYSPMEAVSAWVSLDFIVRAKDAFSSLTITDSGGLWWFLEIGAAVTVAKGIVVDLAFDVPVYVDVNGAQPVPDFIVAGGVRYRF